MANAFISYSHRDIEIVRILVQELRKERTVWVDWHDIPPTVSFPKEIARSITSADNFVFILSPDSGLSDWCNRELDHAVKSGKRLVPVWVRDVDSSQVPAPLQDLHWIDFREPGDLEKVLDLLRIALDNDLEWVRKFTRFQVKASEWEERKRNWGSLLRESDLKEAEQVLAEATLVKKEEPPKLLSEYVQASRDAERRFNRTVIVGILIGLGIAIILALVALYQRNDAVAQSNTRATAEMNALTARDAAVQANATTNAANATTIALANARATAEADAIAEKNRAERQVQISEARRLAEQSALVRSTQLDLALLLALEGLKRDLNGEVKGNLFQALKASPHLIQLMATNIADANSAALSADGKKLALTTQDGTFYLWDVESQKRIATGKQPAAQNDPIISLAFSPDDRYIASGAIGGTVRLWDAETGEPVKTPLQDGDYLGVPMSLPGRRDFIWSVAFSPNGKLLASGSFDGTIVVWDVQTSKPVVQNLRPEESSEMVLQVAFAPDGKTLVSTGPDGHFVLWDVTTWKLIGGPFQLEGNKDWIWSVAFSPDGTKLALGSCGKTERETCTLGAVHLWDLTSQQPLSFPLLAHSAQVNSLTFSPNGKILAAGSRDGTISLWDISAAYPTSTLLSGTTGTVHSLSFSEDSETFTSVNVNGILARWRVADTLVLGSVLDGNSNPVHAMAFTPDSGMLVSGSNEGGLFAWDVHTNTQVWEDTAHPSSLAISPDGNSIAIGNSTGSVLILDAKIRERMDSFEVVNDTVYSVEGLAFSHDGKTLAASSKDKISLWNTETQSRMGIVLRLRDSSDFVQSLAFSPLDNLLAAGTLDGTVQLWDLGTGQSLSPPLQANEYANSVSDLAFRDDGQLIATANSDATIKVWNLSKRPTLEKRLSPHNGSIIGIKFGPTGEIVSASNDGTVTLWNPLSWQPIATLEMPIGSALSAFALSGNGKFAATGNLDGQVILWDLDLDSWKSSACRIANRNLTRAEWEQHVKIDTERFEDYAANPTCQMFVVRQ